MRQPPARKARGAGADVLATRQAARVRMVLSPFSHSSFQPSRVCANRVLHMLPQAAHGVKANAHLLSRAHNVPRSHVWHSSRFDGCPDPTRILACEVSSALPRQLVKNIYMTEPAPPRERRFRHDCAAPDCPNKAHLKCNRCKAARYCGKGCQMKHWKGGHAKVCKAVGATGVSKPAARPGRTDVSKPVPTPPPEDALARQDRLLRGTPHADYIVEVDRTHDRAVAFASMQDRLLFRMLRGKAGKRCRRSLYLMNDILAKSQPEHRERIRQQLRAEYGADPLASASI